MASRKLKITFSAEKDLRRICEWYNENGEINSNDLMSEFDELTRRLENFPEIYPQIYRGYRKAILTRFPYAVYYELTPQLIKIRAIFHNARNPTRLRERLI